MGTEIQPDGRREKDTELLQINDSTRYKNVVGGLGGTTKGYNHRSGKIDGFARPLPELYARREDCCGCAACYAVCSTQCMYYEKAVTYDGKIEAENDLSHGAISMEEDEEGFLYPMVDASLCVRCYRCIDVCPIKRADINKDI